MVMAAAAVARGGERGVAPAKEDTKLPLSSFSAWVVAGEMAAAAVGMFAACGGVVLEREGGVVG